MTAFTEAWRAGLFARQHWLSNIIAGVVVGVVALPLAMAFAIASGAKPEQGLYTAIIAGFVVSVFGGSRVQIAGPTGAFIVILAGITAEHGIAGLQTATLMAGVMLLVLGVARMGGIIRFIPAPVIVGFTAGIGVIIFVSQWREFLGLPLVSGKHFHERLWQLVTAMPQLHVPTAILAGLSLVLVLFAPRVPGLSRVPGPLVALLVATFLQAAFAFPDIRTIGSAFGGIPTGLPAFALPDLAPDTIIVLIGPAFTIAMLGAIESLLSAVVADGMAGTRHDPNRELMGQGLANILTPLFGGFAATGAIARTATNIRNGGTSPLAGIVHSLTLVAVILFLAPYAVHIPLAALAAILFVVAWNMSDVSRFAKMLRRAPRADKVILLVTFVLTVFADLVVAVNIGVILAVLQFLRRMANSVEIQISDRDSTETDDELARVLPQRLPDGVVAFAIEGPMFFGAVENLEKALSHTHTLPGTVIFRLRRVPFIDETALESLEAAIISLQKRGVVVRLAGANPRVAGKLAKAGLLILVGSQHVHRSFEDAIRSVTTEAERRGDADVAG